MEKSPCRGKNISLPRKIVFPAVVIFKVGKAPLADDSWQTYAEHDRSKKIIKQLLDK